MKKNILIIEDCQTMQRFLKTYLERDYIVTLVGTQHEAKCLLAAGQLFNAILIDINLPDGSGLNFITEMKISGNFNTPILAMSGMKDLNVRLDALETGAVDFITKPFLPKELAIRIKNSMVTQTENVKTSEEKIFPSVPALLFAN